MQAPSSTPATSSPIHRRHLVPHIYEPASSDWTPLSTIRLIAASLPRGTLLRIISWNIDFSVPSHRDRTSTALDYLASLFSPPGLTTTIKLAPIILMLQEMSAESMAAILAHAWVREKFIVSEKVPPSQRYFTLLLVDRQLVTAEWFRTAYPETKYKRDVLGVNILVAFDDGSAVAAGGKAENERPAQWLRFCTTHLESLSEQPGFEVRPKQLALVSALLKEDTLAHRGYELVGGVVGGDMNAISELDDAIHRRPEVGLRDIWEENFQGHGNPGRDGAKDENSENDTTSGRAEGHTWGYQARGRWPPRRFDKFFYTGNLGVVPLDEAKDSSGMVGRLGIGVKTAKGKWISDHFGIAVGIKVL